MKTKFSVLVPVHNREEYVRQAIDSVLSQVTRLEGQVLKYQFLPKNEITGSPLTESAVRHSRKQIREGRMGRWFKSNFKIRRD